MWPVGGEDRWSPCRLHMCADTDSGARRVAWRPIACAVVLPALSVVLSRFRLSWAGRAACQGPRPSTRSRSSCCSSALQPRLLKKKNACSSRDFLLAARRLPCVACRDRALARWPWPYYAFSMPAASCSGRRRLTAAVASRAACIAAGCAPRWVFPALRGWAHPTRCSAHKWAELGAASSQSQAHRTRAHRA